MNALPEQERGNAIGTIVGLAYHYLEEGLASVLLEAFKMANALEELIADGILRGLVEGREQGRAQGFEEGRQEGRQEGQLEGKRAALRILVQLRFGAVPVALEQRITEATGEELDGLYARAVLAVRVEDI